MPLQIQFLFHERSFFSRLSWLALTIAIASALTYVRLAGGLGSSGVPLVFYLPAIILTTLAADVWFGVASLVISLILVWVLFVPPSLSWHVPGRDQAITLTLWGMVAGMIVWLCAYLRHSVQELTRNETRYRKLAEVSSDIVWLTDAKGHSHVANETFSRVTGIAWPETAGLKWLQSIHPDDQASLMPSGPRANEFHQVEFRLWDDSAKEWHWYRSRAVAIKDSQGAVIEWITAMRDVHQPKLARERTAIIVGESRHRLKNLVAIIEALAKSSQLKSDKSTPEIVAYFDRFVGRLRALGTAADLALAGQHQIVDLKETVHATLAPFIAGNDRIKTNGPSLVISQQTGGTVALALHELATNAIKYGALSGPDGVAELSWNAKPAGDDHHVMFVWAETGGPPVFPPTKEGYGSRVIRAAVSRERDGRVAIEYRPEGLYCELSFRQTLPTLIAADDMTTTSA